MILNSVFNKISKIKKLINKIFFNPYKYWENRYKDLGYFAPYNILLKNSDLKTLEKSYFDIIFSEINTYLTVDKYAALDFGCGTGRFTFELAKYGYQNIYGIDISKNAISLAKSKNIKQCVFIYSNSNQLPLPTMSMDLIFICLVLGGIKKEFKLKNIISEFYRISKPNSIIVLIENTTNQKNNTHWVYRPYNYYCDLFLPFFDFKRIHYFNELNEEISIFIGTRNNVC